MSSTAFCFKPSKLTAKTEEIWAKSKQEEEEKKSSTNADQNHAPVIGFSSAFGQEKKNQDRHEDVPTKRRIVSPDSNFVFGAKIAERVTADEMVNKKRDAVAGGGEGEKDGGAEEGSCNAPTETAATPESRDQSAEDSAACASEKCVTLSKSGDAKTVGFHELASKGSTFATSSSACSTTKLQQSKDLPLDQQTKSPQKLDLPSKEVPVVTGEEGETTLFTGTCKLHQFDKHKSGWIERGVGVLHVNRKLSSEQNRVDETRLVMRVHGSFRVVLNANIFPDMLLEKAGAKKIRFSVIDMSCEEEAPAEPKPLVFVITVRPDSECSKLFGVLESALSECRRREKKRKLEQSSQKNEEKKEVPDKAAKSNEQEPKSSEAEHEEPVTKLSKSNRVNGVDVNEKENSRAIS